MSRILLALLALGVGLLQAWDSNALQAEASLKVVILVGVLLPAAAIAMTRDVRLRAAAVVVAVTLLAGARYLSAVPMPELALAALFQGMLVLFDFMRALGSNEAAAGRAPQVVSPGARRNDR